MNRELLIKQLQSFLLRFPRFFGVAVYWAVYSLYRVYVRIFYKGSRVWTRNTYRNGNWIPFVSDIDLSILLPPVYSTNLIEQIQLRHYAWRRYLPIVGELNIYHPAKLSEVAQNINIFELSRDPDLQSLLKPQMQRSDMFIWDRITFLLRMLEYDSKLLFAPEQRQRKWRNHFQDSELDAPFWIDRRVVVAVIVKLIGEQGLEGLSESFLKEAIHSFLEASDQEVPWHQWVQANKYASVLGALFPHRFCFAIELKSKHFVGLQRSQIRWELHAALLQSPDGCYFESLAQHLHRLSLWEGDEI